MESAYVEYIFGGSPQLSDCTLPSYMARPFIGGWPECVFKEGWTGVCMLENMVKWGEQVLKLLRLIVRGYKLW